MEEETIEDTDFYSGYAAAFGQCTDHVLNNSVNFLSPSRTLRTLLLTSPIEFCPRNNKITVMVEL